MDIADKAAEIEEMNRAQALAARRRIPAAPGCTECQARHERHAKNR